MGTAPGHQDHKLAFYKALAQQPYAFDWLAVLRKIEQLNPELPRIGYADKPADETLRLGQQVSMSFAAAEIASFCYSESEDKYHLNHYDFGLYGPNGPMPLFLTDHIARRQANNEQDYFYELTNLLTHRLCSFFYRAATTSRPTFERLDESDTSFKKYGLALAGLTGADDDALFYAGRFGFPHRTAEGLEAILSTQYEITVAVEEFVPQRLKLDASSCCYLGATGELGAGSYLGTSVIDQMAKFRIVLGPLSKDQYESLLPDTAGLENMAKNVKKYVGYEFNFEFQLVLSQKETLDLWLGAQSKLGWTSGFKCKTKAKMKIDWNGPHRWRSRQTPHVPLAPDDLMNPRGGLSHECVND